MKHRRSIARDPQPQQSPHSDGHGTTWRLPTPIGHIFRAPSSGETGQRGCSRSLHKSAALAEAGVFGDSFARNGETGAARLSQNCPSPGLSHSGKDSEDFAIN